MVTKTVEISGLLRHPQQALPNGMLLGSYLLGNGLRVLLVERRDAPVFSFQTWVMAGSVTEKCDPRLDRTGIAHLFEHLMFRGTPRYPDGAYDSALTRAGGVDINASTWYDRTNYYVSLPSEKLDLVLELEADRYENLILSKDLLEAEKGAVLGEYELGQDDPETVIYDRLYEAAFDRHPYRWSTIGTRREIESISLEDARYFYSCYYTPGNTALIAVGDFDSEELIGKIASSFGGIRKNPCPELVIPSEPTQTSERRLEIIHGHLECDRLIVAYKTPPPKDPEFAALWLAQAIFSEGRSAVLGRRWVETGLASTASGDLDQFRDPGLLAFDAELQPGSSHEELLAVLEEAVSEHISDPAMIEADLERAKNQLLLRVYDEWEDHSGVASFMGESLASAGDPVFGFRLIEKIRGVGADEVARAMKRFLVPAGRTVLFARSEE